MRMRIISGFVLLFLIMGCTDKDKIPSGVLPREEMGNVLWDMVQADQYADIYVTKDTSRINKKIETLKLYDMVLRMHKVSRDEFRKSFQFYKDRPDLSRPMFDSLLARGNRLRTESYSRMSAVVKPPAGAPLPAVNNGVKPGFPGNLPGHMPAHMLPNGKPPVMPMTPLNRGAGKPGMVKDTLKTRMNAAIKGNGKPLLTPGKGARNPVTTPPGAQTKNK